MTQQHQRPRQLSREFQKSNLRLFDVLDVVAVAVVVAVVVIVVAVAAFCEVVFTRGKRSHAYAHTCIVSKLCCMVLV